MKVDKHYRPEDINYMKKMRSQSHHKYVVCKNGPSCSNHDWDYRSPLQKFCRRGINCLNHDWSNVDRYDSPYKLVCRKGPKCSKHNWGSRSPLQRRPEKQHRTIASISRCSSSSSSSDTSDYSQKRQH
jgi:hypothetical protein